MPYRGSRLNDTGLAINTEIGSRYDKVKVVADSIEKVEVVADNIDDVKFVGENIVNIDIVGSNIDNVNTVAENINSVPDMVDVTEELIDAYAVFNASKAEIEANRELVEEMTDRNESIYNDIQSVSAVGVSSDKTSAEFNPNTGVIEIEIERGTKIFAVDVIGTPKGTENFPLSKFDSEPFVGDLVVSTNYLVGRVVEIFGATITVEWYGELKGEAGLGVYNTNIYLSELAVELDVNLVNVPEARELKVDDTIFSPSGTVFTVEGIEDGIATIKSLTNLNGPKGEDGKSITNVTTSYNINTRVTTVTIYGNFYDAPVSFEVRDGVGGDMYTAIYDPSRSGIVLEAEKAQALKTPIELSVSGDVRGSASFDGSVDTDIEIVLNDTGVVAGSYTKFTVDAKGRITEASIAESDVPVGGLTGEVLAKAGDDDYNFGWIDIDETLGNKVVGVIE